MGYVNPSVTQRRPWKWADEVDDWAARWPSSVVEYPTNSNTRMAPAVDRFRTALAEDRLHHDGDPDLTRHVLNARLRKVGRDADGRGRYVIEKAGPGRLIDGCVVVGGRGCSADRADET